MKAIRTRGKGGFPYTWVIETNGILWQATDWQWDIVKPIAIGRDLNGAYCIPLFKTKRDCNRAIEELWNHGHEEH